MEFQIVRTTDPQYPYFWRVVDDLGHMLTYSSARYRSKDECIEAVRSVQRGAADAGVLYSNESDAEIV